MFTVVIAQQEILDSIREYGAFLEPLSREAEIAYCPWNIDGRTLEETVPTLSSTVGTRRLWRAVIVTDRAGIHLKNPFEIVEVERSGIESEAKGEMVIDQLRRKSRNLAAERRALTAAYHKAALQPLTRLTTFLTEDPTATRLTEGTDPETMLADFEREFEELEAAMNSEEVREETVKRLGSAGDMRDKMDFAQYRILTLEKQRVKTAIRGEEIFRFAMPAQILCVARRCYREEEREFRITWSEHREQEYSRFYDWNLYSDRLRYLLFDIQPETDNSYFADYLRFLTTLLILASNEMPQGALSPNRVYVLESRNDEAAMQHLISLYDARMAMTQDSLNSRLNQVLHTEQKRLTDSEARSLFGSGVQVTLHTAEDIDRTGLKVDTHRIGLSDGCPGDEFSLWKMGLGTAKRTLAALIKQPRRALKQGTEDLRRISTADLARVRDLNEFQLSDVESYVGQEQVRMTRELPHNIFDPARFDKAMEDHDAEVSRKIDERMGLKTTLFIGILAILVYLAGFVPLFLHNYNGRSTRLTALYISLGAVGILAVMALITLFVLRWALTRRVGEFNDTMKGFAGEVDDSMRSFSDYLSHMANVMRGFSALNFRREHPDPISAEAGVLRKHLGDLKAGRQTLKSLFGDYIRPEAVEPEEVTGYDFDFERAVDYKYPLPYTPDMRRDIEFIQKGQQVTVPVDYIGGIRVRREELYEL